MRTGIALALCGLACGADLATDRECADYVACSYRTGVTAGSLDAMYGGAGTCWNSPNASDSCHATCKAANDAFKSSGVAADAGCTFGG